MTVMPSLSWMSRMRPRMDWVVCGSRALVASSQRRILGSRGQGAGNGHPLLLAAGELGRVGSCTYPPGLPAPEAPLARLHRRRLFSCLPAPWGKQTFFWHVRCIRRLKPWKIMVISPALPAQLGLGAGPPCRGRRSRILPPVGPLQHVDAAHQGALAGAAHADDAVDFAVGDRQADVFQRLHRLRRRSGRFLSGVGSGSCGSSKWK